MIIAIDFDGTVVSHQFPGIGPDRPLAVDRLMLMQRFGHKLILFTMRSGEHLDEAVKWFEDRGIKLWGINTNPGQKHWTSSPKAYAEVYIDDAALGAPTEYDEASQRRSIDWSRIVVDDQGVKSINLQNEVI